MVQPPLPRFAALRDQAADDNGQPIIRVGVASVPAELVPSLQAAMLLDSGDELGLLPLGEIILKVLPPQLVIGFQAHGR